MREKETPSMRCWVWSPWKMWLKRSSSRRSWTSLMAIVSVSDVSWYLRSEGIALFLLAFFLLQWTWKWSILFPHWRFLWSPVQYRRSSLSSSYPKARWRPAHLLSFYLLPIAFSPEVWALYFCARFWVLVVLCSYIAVLPSQSHKQSVFIIVAQNFLLLRCWFLCDFL